ncbi:MAG: hypothetical protein IPF75_14220 [Bacteroidetes bacterium]|nr:hypothetical protein [Bacteroidota bacterium]
MEWSIGGSYLMKNDLMILNILANNNWKRPIYFATTVGSDNYLNLGTLLPVRRTCISCCSDQDREVAQQEIVPVVLKLTRCITTS